MERLKITIDGENFSTLEGFFDELARLLVRDADLPAIRSMDAARDVLRGGFGVQAYGQGIDFVWRNAAKSRHDLGWPATVRYWQARLQKCHPANRVHTEQRLARAQRGEGPTLFTMLTGLILDKSDAYDHTLRLDDAQ